jgi:predicted dehydrogenase
MTAQVLRFLPAYAKTAELVKSAQLGPVRSALLRRRCAAPAWSKWLSNPAVSGGGVFDLLIHDVDYCVYLFGEPEAVSATGYEDMPRGIDCIAASFHYPGLDVVVTGGWHHPKAYPFSMEFTVVSDGKSAVQVAPQATEGIGPSGSMMTVPLPVPIFDTVNR